MSIVLAVALSAGRRSDSFLRVGELGCDNWFVHGVSSYETDDTHASCRSPLCGQRGVACFLLILTFLQILLNGVSQ